MRVAVVLALLLTVVLPARADEPRPFAVNFHVELPIFAAGALLGVGSEAMKATLGPDHCRLCGRSDFDRHVQSALRWDHVRPARRLSDVLLYALVPAFSLASTVASAHTNGSSRIVAEDLLVLGESVALTSVLTQAVKFSVARKRPYLQTASDRGDMLNATSDDFVSFFSGHTSLTFALAVGAGSIASLRGYEQAPWIWAIGVPLAAFTGYLRIAADRHYLTDVIAGSLFGSAMGALIPWLHRHYAGNDRPIVSASPPGMVTMTWLL